MNSNTKQTWHTVQCTVANILKTQDKQRSPSTHHICTANTKSKNIWCL